MILSAFNGVGESCNSSAAVQQCNSSSMSQGKPKSKDKVPLSQTASEGG